MDLPLSSRIINATPKTPHISLFFKFDIQEVRQVLMELGSDPKESKPNERFRGLVTGSNTEKLIEALLRFVELLETPEDIPLMRKLIHKEIIYRILKTEQGPRLRQLAQVGSSDFGIWKAIEWLKKNFSKPYNLEKLARSTNMGTSTLHHHFKKITSMSPLQYQKRLRLYEARRLLIDELIDAGTAGFRVGYESQSQFNREYKRLFGQPPIRDIQKLKRY